MLNATQIADLATLLCEHVTVNDDDQNPVDALCEIIKGFCISKPQPQAATEAVLCPYVFTKGKTAGQTCGAKNCKRHANKAAPKPAAAESPKPAEEAAVLCPYVFTKGKNAGEACGAKNCKKHSAKTRPAPAAEQPAPAPEAPKKGKKKAVAKGEEPEEQKDEAPKQVMPTQENFSFETTEPIGWCKENMAWWKNWRNIAAEFTKQEGCRMHRTTKIVISLDGDGRPHFVGHFNEGKFTPKHQVAPAIYSWVQASGFLMD